MTASCHTRRPVESGESWQPSTCDDAGVTDGRMRREPPRFRRVEVAATRALSPRLMRVQLRGEELAGFAIPAPAASVRVLLPRGTELELPQWTGNEFRTADGSRAPIRTFTPRAFDASTNTLTVDVVLHGNGAASEWATTARPASPAAVSGPGRGYTVDQHAPGFLVAGDETAIPAIAQLLESLPAAPARVAIEVVGADARIELPAHPTARVSWHELDPGAAPGDAFVAALRALPVAPGTKVWVAGEAAAVQRARRYCFEERGIPRADTWIRGYWKHGRAGDDGPTD
jgi:NADPH-dependent ferric siderophore reductase